MNRVRRPIVIAHRGASGYLPEHTLAAKALAHGMGADFLEQDVVLSSDGVPVVLHDIHLDCTTDVAQCFPDRVRDDGRYYAADFSLAELRRLKVCERRQRDAAGAWSPAYPQRFPAGPGLFGIPTLEEEIALIAGLDHSRRRETGLYIELKAPNWHRAQGLDPVAAVMDVLRRTGYDQRTAQVFLQCFDDATLRRLREEVGTPLPLIQLIADPSWGEDSAVDYDYLQTREGLAYVAGYAAGIGPWLQQIYRGRSPGGQPLLSDLVDDAHAAGLVVHTYTLRSDDLPPGVSDFGDLMCILVDLAKVDGLFTDFPDLAVDWLDG